MFFTMSETQEKKIDLRRGLLVKSVIAIEQRKLRKAQKMKGHMKYGLVGGILGEKTKNGFSIRKEMERSKSEIFWDLG